MHMNKQAYFTVVTTLFSLIALLHILRIVYNWPAQIGGWNVPMWISWLAVVIAGALAYQGFKMRGRI